MAAQPLTLVECLTAAEQIVRDRGWHHGPGFHPDDVFDAANEAEMVERMKVCAVTPMGAIYAALIDLPAPTRANITAYVKAKKAIRALAVGGGLVPPGTELSGSKKVAAGLVAAADTIEPQFSAWNAAPERTLDDIFDLFARAVQAQREVA